MALIYSSRHSSTEKENKNISFLQNSYSPKSIWDFWKAVFSWDLLFCSAQLWIEPSSMKVVKWWIEAETRQACRNIANLLKENGLTFRNVAKTTIYLKSMIDYEKINSIYKNYFIMKPSCTILWVNELPKWWLIQIEIIAKK